MTVLKRLIRVNLLFYLRFICLTRIHSNILHVIKVIQPKFLFSMQENVNWIRRVNLMERMGRMMPRKPKRVCIHLLKIQKLFITYICMFIG